MNRAEPIKNPKQLQLFKDFYRVMEPDSRNYLLITVALNTALRISDILTLRWGDIYDFSKASCPGHLVVTEKKTGKETQIFINDSIRQALSDYRDSLKKGELCADTFLFPGSRTPCLNRVQAWRIIREAAEKCGISGVISPHSLRKTFGYHAWKQGTPPAMLMDIYQHSSYEITKRYLGISQDERDEVFRNIAI
ncbi:MAG: tyrosine-type recombinase/integrase [Muribaculaceae bacterium]|nr:tyrosine-type recombinase/integrase [Roseburia sp.]MCM1431461.1 tyrosine-type recombinase/integrase [Muribaculaceae bacterium]MCM1493245.1 tyrosine-type recombinase/integrase [Muribaculaceae bacterium]